MDERILTPGHTPAAGRFPVDETRVSPEEWPEALVEVAGPQLVLGGPGTGKTEFLARRAVHLLTEEVDVSERVLLLSFTRGGASDLRRRIRARLDRSVGRIGTTTYHGLALELLETYAARRGWPEPPTVLAGPEHVHLVGTLLAEEDPRRWSPAFRGLLPSPAFAAEVTDFLLRCREELVDAAALAELAASRDDWRGLPEFLRRYDRALRAQGRIDYGTLLTEAVALLEDPEVRRRLGERLTYVLVDEYQDTTTARSALLRLLVAHHRNLTAAADPYQAIYGFRGTSPGSLERFAVDFPPLAGGRCRRLVLTTSFRVPAAILAAAVRVAGPDLPGMAGPVLPAPGRGSVETYHFPHRHEEAGWIAAEIERLHREQGIPYGSMAVLVRNTRRLLPELSQALEHRHVPHERPDARLVDRPVVRLVLDCVRAAAGAPEVRDAALRRLLLGPLFRLTIGQLHDLRRRRTDDDPEHVLDHVPAAGALAELLHSPEWATSLPAAAGLWHLWTSLPQLVAFVMDPERAAERAAWGSFAQVLERATERDPSLTLVDHLRLTHEEGFEPTPLLARRPGDEDRLTLATLHQVKGREFSVVFIADAVEGVLPDLRARDSLLGTRHLTPHLSGDTARYRARRLEEERRLAYTAMTRVTRRVVWTTADVGPDGTRATPSRFLAYVVDATAETGGADTTAPGRYPVTPREWEASLKRTLTDPAAPSTERLAALVILADGPRVGLRPPDRLAGALPRGSDRGLVGPDPTLSPSQALLFEECPRRYALERRLGMGVEGNVHAEFGRLLHAVLERVEREALARGEAHGTLAEARHVLDDLFSPARFGGEPMATAWRRRAEAALNNLYARWPSPGRVIDVERPVELRHAGHRWKGRVDRLEERDGTVVVVDYKTARTPATLAEAATSLQLGFYALALASDPSVPPEAEFWYPLGPGRAALTVRRFDGAALDDVAARLAAAGAGIRAERWPAIVGDGCRVCAVRAVCPALPEGREAFLP